MRSDAMGETVAMERKCRHCGSLLSDTFADLGVTPLSNSYVDANSYNEAELFFPLHAYVCGRCFLVQLEEFQSPENIFQEYAYFSSYSDSWLQHARSFAEETIRRFSLTDSHRVVEVASNDGYLLQFFQQRNIPVLGIEPAKNVAAVAKSKGIQTVESFFGTSLAKKLVASGLSADVLIGNNVLAHVPDINDFVKGLNLLLTREGVLALEFPHVLQLIQNNQFDTIYHEHFSYLSLLTVEKILQSAGLEVFDVDELPTHGGSLRIYAKHRQNDRPKMLRKIEALRHKEAVGGLGAVETYTAFASRACKVKRDLLAFLIDLKRQGKTVVAYGAAAKGNTLLNYCGIRTDFVEYVVDRNQYKQGKFLPGTRIPILHPDRIAETRPDYILVLPWNLKNEIVEQLAYVRSWGGKFVVPIPQVEVIQ